MHHGSYAAAGLLSSEQNQSAFVNRQDELVCSIHVHWNLCITAVPSFEKEFQVFVVSMQTHNQTPRWQIPRHTSLFLPASKRMGNHSMQQSHYG
jgi:hypothetical protein